MQRKLLQFTTLCSKRDCVCAHLGLLASVYLPLFLKKRGLSKWKHNNNSVYITFSCIFGSSATAAFQNTRLLRLINLLDNELLCTGPAHHMQCHNFYLLFRKRNEPRAALSKERKLLIVLFERDTLSSHSE